MDPLKIQYFETLSPKTYEKIVNSSILVKQNRKGGGFHSLESLEKKIETRSAFKSHDSCSQAYMNNY